MKGVKDFIMRGNLVELAVAIISDTASATVIKALTNVFLSLIGKIGGKPDFSSIKPGAVPLGAFSIVARCGVVRVHIAGAPLLLVSNWTGGE